MQRYTIFYHESSQDANSWKSKPKAAFIKAEDSAKAKEEFKLRFPDAMFLSIVSKNIKRRIENDQPK